MTDDGLLFAHSQAEFQAIVGQALNEAKRLGASDAAAEASEGMGLSVSVRKGELENIERNRDKSLGVTVYLGARRGNASTSDFSLNAIRQTVRAALDIAKFTAEDPFACLPDERDLALDAAANSSRVRQLDLLHPWALSAEEATALALRCEQAAFAVDPRINNSEGAGVSAQQSQFWLANTRGFAGGYALSRHSLSVAPIAQTPGNPDDMQRDAWYVSQRRSSDLAAPEAVGRYAAERALSRLAARKIPTCEVPVLFESTLATGLMGSFVQCVSGGALYRKASFLTDTLGQRLWADHVDLIEDPMVVRGKASAPFDDEGVLTTSRRVVDAGVLQGYFLSVYSARKLGMRSTGNAGGSHNLTLSSRLTRPEDGLPGMLRKLHRGLFVTELMGQGVNSVTGDYSRGASGYWVENGEIAYPVHEITIAGHLGAMMQQVAAIGADAYTYGGKTTGSVLIERMKVAGS